MVGKGASWTSKNRTSPSLPRFLHPFLKDTFVSKYPAHFELRKSICGTLQYLQWCTQSFRTDGCFHHCRPTRSSAPGFRRPSGLCTCPWAWCRSETWWHQVKGMRLGVLATVSFKNIAGLDYHLVLLFCTPNVTRDSIHIGIRSFRWSKPVQQMHASWILLDSDERCFVAKWIMI